MKITILVFAAIAILAFLGVFATILSQPEPPKNEYDQQQPQNEQPEAQPSADGDGQNQPDRWGKYKHQIKDYWTRFIEFTEKYDKAIVALSTVGIFLFTLALFLATYLLYTAGERHSERQLRAYVFLFKTEISDIMSDQQLAVTLVVKNFGQTPAYDVETSIGIEAAPFPLIMKLPLAVHKTKNTNIGPGADITMNFKGDEPAVIEWRPRFTQKTGAVYVYGTIKYVDAFKIRRFTDFRFYKGGDIGVVGPELSVSTGDNKAN